MEYKKEFGALRDIDFYQTDGDVDNDTTDDELRITARSNASICGSNLDLKMRDVNQPTFNKHE